MSDGSTGPFPPLHKLCVSIERRFLTGDVRFVGPYLEFCRDLSFVLEDSLGVCGYVLAALDSKKFYQTFKEEWLPKVLALYPRPPPSTQPPGPELVGNAPSAGVI